MSCWEESHLCTYLACQANAPEGWHHFCPYHYRIDRDAVMARIDNRNPQKKEQLYRGQHGRCNYCGREFEIDYLVWEHMTPPRQGGSNAIGNLQLTCQPCNNKKHLRTDRQFRDDNQGLLPRQPRMPASPPVRSADLKRINSSRLRSQEARTETSAPTTNAHHLAPKVGSPPEPGYPCA